MFKQSFAIKIGKTLNDKVLAEAIVKLSKLYPKLKVEGLGERKLRKAKYKDPELSVKKNTLIIQQDLEEQEYITVGFSNKYDISFETKSKVFACGFIPLVKVLDIRKDFDKIMDRLSSFVITKYPKRSVKLLKNNFKIERKANSKLLNICGMLITSKGLKAAAKKTKSKELENLVVLI